MKILLSPSSIGKLSSKPIDILKEKGLEVIVNPYGRKLTKEETVQLASDCVGVVAGVELYDNEVLDALPNLKCISRVGVGMDSVDIPNAESRGIKVVNTPHGPTQAVAELALGLTMTALRKIGQAHHNLKSGIWKKENGYLLEGKTIGVVGVGRIGKKTAEIFRALGCEVIGSDLYPNEEWAKNFGIKFMELKLLLEKADVVILHLPGLSSGNPVLGSEELALMKDESILVNLARGGVLNEDALIAELEKGKFTGIALDVFSQEPYEGPLTKFEQVILTPHIGSYAKEGKIKMEIDAVQNLINAISE